MSTIFQRNAIIIGNLDFFCLCCEEYIISERETLQHILNVNHNEHLSLTSYVEAYKNNCIRKVKNVYLCELCNLLMKTKREVGLHVSEQRHHSNKDHLAENYFRRISDKVVLFDDVLISDAAWSGIIDDSCAICDMEFDDVNEHKMELKHSLKLIQSKIEVDGYNKIYRKVDLNTFQCLTCNELFNLNTIFTHYDSLEHKKLYEMCHNNYKAVAYGQNYHKSTATQLEVARSYEIRPPIPEVKEILPVKASTSVEVTKSKESVKTTAVKSEKRPSEQLDHDKHITKTPLGISAVESEQKIRQIRKDMDEHNPEVLKTKAYVCEIEGNYDWCIICGDDLTEPVSSHLKSDRHKMAKVRHDQKKAELSTTNSVNNDHKTNNITVGETKSQSVKTDKFSKILERTDQYKMNDMIISMQTSTAYCRKCSKNVSFELETIESHIEDHKKKGGDHKIHSSKQHEENKKQVKGVETASKNKNQKNVKVEQKTETKEANVTKDTKTQNNFSKLKENVEEFRQNGMIMSIENSTAYCKKCSKDINFDLDSIRNHIEEHKKRKVSDEIAKYAKENYLTYDSTKNNYICQVCETTISSSLKSLKKHVTNTTHEQKQKLGKAKVKIEKPTLTKIPISHFIKTMSVIDESSFEGYVINKELFVSHLSFLTLAICNDILRCQICEISFLSGEFITHFGTMAHFNEFQLIPVLTNFENEFIREIRLGVYHCGFCNILSSSLEELDTHLKSVSHNESKIISTWRVKQCLPDINRQEPVHMSLHMLLRNTFDIFM